MRVSERHYSLKNIEGPYCPARDGGVQSAGGSTVAYERWKLTREQQLLKQIQAHNEDDVRLTAELREWLVQHRPQDLPWPDERRLPTTKASATGRARSISARSISWWFPTMAWQRCRRSR